MKILEVREGFIKFQADSDICLSSFVRIQNNEKSYIAQVIQIKQIENNSIGYAKILFMLSDKLENYDNSVPDANSEIVHFSYEQLQSENLPLEPVISGKTLDDNTNIILDVSAFANNMLISVDDNLSKNIFIRNFAKQFNHIGKNVLVLDTTGSINAKKIIAGSDFKLPLDTASLTFMYEDCLNDATEDSKSMIVDLFRDLSEYSKTVKFLPFDVLKNIVDDMVDKSHVFKLLVLKNKLAKFKTLGYFASNESEVNTIDKILNSKCAIIDLSKLDSAFQNRYISYIYQKLRERKDIQAIVELSNVITKKNLKDIIISKDTKTTVITHSKFKYLNEISGIFSNYIVKPSKQNKVVFNRYSAFLETMADDTCLIVGDGTNYIPIVSKIEEISEMAEISFSKETEQEAENDLSEESTNLESSLPIKIDEDEVIEQDEAIEQDEVIEQEEAIEQEDSVISDVEIEAEEVSKPPKYSSDEIIANINEKTSAVLDAVKTDIQEPDSLNMFSDGSDIQEEFIGDIEQEDSIIQEIAVQEQESDNVELEIQEDIIQNQELQDVEEISEESIQIPVAEDAGELDLEAENSDILDNELENNSENQEISESSDALGLQNVEVIDIEENEPNDVPYIEQDITNDNLISIDSDESSYNEDLILNQESGDDELPYNAEQSDITLNENIDEDSINVVSDAKDTEDSSLEVMTEEVDTIEYGDDIDLDLSGDNEILETGDEILEQGENNTEISINNLEEQESFPDDEFIELDSSEAEQDDILIDMSEDDFGTVPNLETEEQIVKDVDKMYTTHAEDEFTDSDLDIIDELNEEDSLILDEDDNNDDLLEEIADSGEDSGIIEEYQAPEEEEKYQKNEPEILETRNAAPTMVPVYDADIPQEDIVMSDPIQQGDTVVHAKYGNGVVEKMIKYGNKTLFSINFDNVGRRLLDPTLAEIKKA